MVAARHISEEDLYNETERIVEQALLADDSRVTLRSHEGQLFNFILRSKEGAHHAIANSRHDSGYKNQVVFTHGGQRIVVEITTEEPLQ